MNTHINKNARPVCQETCRTLDAPAGLEYYAGFIFISEGQTLLTVIDTQPWEQDDTVCIRGPAGCYN